jgi:hypothetical protein
MSSGWHCAQPFLRFWIDFSGASGYPCAFHWIAVLGQVRR